MNFRKVKFITSAIEAQGWPEANLPEVVLIGKSNVGKSTLINLLVNQKIAKVSGSPGHTKTLNFFEIDQKLRLVDAPGHGFAGTSKSIQNRFNTMMSEYLSNRKKLKAAIILLDGRRDISEDDLNIHQILKTNSIKTLIVITKADKLNQSLKAKINKEIKNKLNEVTSNDVIFVSALKPDTIKELQLKITSISK